MINQNSEQYRGRQDYPSQTNSFCAEKKKKKDTQGAAQEW